MKTVILYRTFLGTTKKYAQWISEEIYAEMHKTTDLSKEDFKNYNNIIICSGTYMGWISITNYLKKIWPDIKGKNVILMVTGIYPENSIQSQNSFNQIPEEIRNSVKYFKLPGQIGSVNSALVKKENIKPIVNYFRSVTSSKEE
jgi:flavodoxin